MTTTTTTIDNNNLATSIEEMKETMSDENNNNNESELSTSKMDDSGSNSLQQTVNVDSVHFQLRQEASPSGQISYKMIPFAQNEVSIYNGSDSKLDMIQNLEAPVFFMMPTQEIVQSNNHKMITKSPSNSKLYSQQNGTGGGKVAVRDERRRANHNEVERRRRDNINKWIVELSKVIPDCSHDHTKHGQSKGGILEKTVQYLIDMKLANDQLTDRLKSFEEVKHENELLRQENEGYKKENQYLKMQLDKKIPS